MKFIFFCENEHTLITKKTAINTILLKIRYLIPIIIFRGLDDHICLFLYNLSLYIFLQSFF